MSLYRTLYIRIYQVCEQHQKRDDVPEWTASGLVASLLMLNVLAIAMALEWSVHLRLDVLTIFGLTASVGAASMAINYLSFIRNEEYRRLRGGYEESNGAADSLSKAAVVAYVAVSVTAFAVLAMVMLVRCMAPVDP